MADFKYKGTEANDRLRACGAGDYEHDDDCPQCGATWRESADCALNGCPFGVYERSPMQTQAEEQR